MRRRARARSLITLVLTAVLGLAGLLACAPTARAAEVPNAVTDLTFTSTVGPTIDPWEQVKLTAEWSVPDGTPAGSTFGMSWSASDMVAVPQTGIQLKNPAGAVVATCATTQTSMTCTLTDYVTAHPTSLYGSLFTLVRMGKGVSGSTDTISVDVGGTTPVDVPIDYTDPVSFPGVGYGKAAVIRADGSADWFVNFAAGPNGQSADLVNVTVEDTVGAGQRIIDGTFTLQHATGLDADGAWPAFVPVSAAAVPHTFTMGAGNTSFTFTAPLLEGTDATSAHYWRLSYQVEVAPGATEIKNNATIKATDVDENATSTVIYFDAGGDANASIPPSVSVGDYVWYDADHDGIQDDGAKAGIPGVTLTLTGPDGKQVTNVFGKVVAPVKTDANGTYLFENLPVLNAGQSYTVTVTPPAGYIPTKAGVGDRAKDSSTGSAKSLSLTTDGAKDLTLDFGFYRQMNLVLAKKLVTAGPFEPGDTVTYTLTPKNEGPSPARAVWSVTDVLPAGLSLVSISGPGYTCTKANPTRPVCVAAKGLAAGQSGAAITVKATIKAGVTGVQKNVAYVSPHASDIPETNPLVVPTLTTDTSTSPTDNDAQAQLTVTSPPPTNERPPLPQTGNETSAAALAGAIVLTVAGAGALVASRRRRNG